LRVEFQETELQRRVKQAGGKWNSAKRVWEIHFDQAVALGLKKREELYNALAKAIEKITAQDILGRFKQCGYVCSFN
jgi:hypothetical protein